MKMSCDLSNALIQKEIISPGRKYKPLVPGTRVKFHFQTRKCGNNSVILDDSKTKNQPMELVLGKEFKLEVWEAIVQKMAINEISKFRVDKTLVSQYPFISKTLRDLDKKKEERHHCCGMTLQNEGLGYKDLDELFNNPCDLEFVIELLSAELPEEYEKDHWQLSDSEKLKAIVELKEKGNNYYKEKKIEKSEDCYKRALGMIEQLMLKEKPHDNEWLALAALKVPLLLNYSQCRLMANDYYAVIEHCTEALKYEPKNLKAIYRRARAHVGAWNPDLAIKDFKECIQLDSSLSSKINRELQNIIEEKRIKDLEDKIKLQKLF